MKVAHFCLRDLEWGSRVGIVASLRIPYGNARSGTPFKPWYGRTNTL